VDFVWPYLLKGGHRIAKLLGEVKRFLSILLRMMLASGPAPAELFLTA